jgi:hypothetical protein
MAKKKRAGIRGWYEEPDVVAKYKGIHDDSWYDAAKAIYSDLPPQSKVRETKGNWPHLKTNFKEVELPEYCTHLANATGAALNICVQARRRGSMSSVLKYLENLTNFASQLPSSSENARNYVRVFEGVDAFLKAELSGASFYKPLVISNKDPRKMERIVKFMKAFNDLEGSNGLPLTNADEVKKFVFGKKAKTKRKKEVDESDDEENIVESDDNETPMVRRKAPVKQRRTQKSSSESSNSDNGDDGSSASVPSVQNTEEAKRGSLGQSRNVKSASVPSKFGIENAERSSSEVGSRSYRNASGQSGGLSDVDEDMDDSNVMEPEIVITEEGESDGAGTGSNVSPSLDFSTSKSRSSSVPIRDTPKRKKSPEENNKSGESSKRKRSSSTDQTGKTFETGRKRKEDSIPEDQQGYRIPRKVAISPSVSNALMTEEEKLKKRALARQAKIKLMDRYLSTRDSMTSNEVNIAIDLIIGSERESCNDVEEPLNDCNDNDVTNLLEKAKTSENVRDSAEANDQDSNDKLDVSSEFWKVGHGNIHHTLNKREVRYFPFCSEKVGSLLKADEEDELIQALHKACSAEEFYPHLFDKTVLISAPAVVITAIKFSPDLWKGFNLIFSPNDHLSLITKGVFVEADYIKNLLMAKGGRHVDCVVIILDEYEFLDNYDIRLKHTEAQKEAVDLSASLARHFLTSLQSIAAKLNCPVFFGGFLDVKIPNDRFECEKIDYERKRVTTFVLQKHHFQGYQVLVNQIRSRLFQNCKIVSHCGNCGNFAGKKGRYCDTCLPNAYVKYSNCTILNKNFLSREEKIVSKEDQEQCCAFTVAGRPNRNYLRFVSGAVKICASAICSGKFTKDVLQSDFPRPISYLHSQVYEEEFQNRDLILVKKFHDFVGGLAEKISEERQVLMTRYEQKKRSDLLKKNRRQLHTSSTTEDSGKTLDILLL